MSKPLEDYGFIGNMNTGALVARDGSIDWLCLPRFDAPACFAALLSDGEHGRWQIAPAGEIRRVTRRYRADSLVLDTTFETDSGRVTLTDFLPLTEEEDRINVIRIVRGEAGEVALRAELVLRFDCGRTVPWVWRRGHGLSAIAGPDAIELVTDLPLRGEHFRTVGQFTVHAGESRTFTLADHRSYHQAHLIGQAEEILGRTCESWREWSRRGRVDGTVDGRWPDAVMRSLITLKGLTYRPTGGILTAATTSLPEVSGGRRNWDYRYCWIRDATFTLDAGYRDDARAWREWLLRAVAGRPDQLQIRYSIAGDRSLPELILDWLPGYAGSQPVRIGNAAHGQCQLDGYGELMGMLHIAREAELTPIANSWTLQRTLLKHLERLWPEPDEGIWEMRGGHRYFTHSRLIAWVAFDRAVKSVECFGLAGPVAHWRDVRARADPERAGATLSRRGCAWRLGERRRHGPLMQLLASGLLCHARPMEGCHGAVRAPVEPAQRPRPAR